MTAPCGKCVGCESDRARDWAMRCYHEAQLWPENCFLTLTYSPESLPVSPEGIPTLRPEDMVLFLKRLRKHFEPLRIRFFQAGEYGKLGRPHHHVLLFNCWFPDAKPIMSRSSGQLYRSAQLEELWPHGFSSVGWFTGGAAFYVAQYAVKKLVSTDVPGRVPEYRTMSRRPGIGASWVGCNAADVLSAGHLVTPEGGKASIPRFYEGKLAEAGHADELRSLKAGRKAYRDQRPFESHADRLHAREVVHRARLSFSRREVD